MFEIEFHWGQLPVRLPFSAEGLCQNMLKAEPWSNRRSLSRADYEADKREKAGRGVWRHAAHYLKATFEAVEYGILSFEQAFLHGFATPSGKTLGQVLIPQLQQVYSGQLALPEPPIEAETGDFIEGEVIEE